MPEEPRANPETDTEQPTLDVRRLVVTTLLGLVLIMLVAAGIGAWLREPMEALSRAFVERLGGPGVAMGYFLPDAFTVPLPSDAFGLFGLAGGLSFTAVVTWGTVGSVAGGSTGYLVGRGIARTHRVRRAMKARGQEIRALVDRYGAVAVAAAALTPLPYSIACWAAGALGMPFPTFLAVSFLRVLRVAGYLWVVQTGFLALQ